MTTFNLLDEEARRSFDFFWKEANTDKNSPGYGLILDKTLNSATASLSLTVRATFSTRA